jgi:hypothetical protein
MPTSLVDEEPRVASATPLAPPVTPGHFAQNCTGHCIRPEANRAWLLLDHAVFANRA